MGSELDGGAAVDSCRHCELVDEKRALAVKYFTTFS